MAESGGEDSWTAPDKFQHVLFCFSLTLTFSLLAARAAHPFLRRRPLTVGSVISLSAGAAKEFADHLGYFHSAGASTKDAAADAAGVLLACFVLSVFRFVCSKRKSDEGGVARGDALV